MENKEQTALYMRVFTPLTAHFFSNDARQEDSEVTEEEYGLLLTGEDLAQYEKSIRERVLRENCVDEKNLTSCNLMEYFHGSDSIKEKVSQAVVSVKNTEGVLYGCTTLTLRAYLEVPELQELCEYITGQYADGWGKGFEQRDIYVDGGYLNVHFYQPKSYKVQEYETKKVETELRHERASTAKCSKDSKKKEDCR